MEKEINEIIGRLLAEHYVDRCGVVSLEIGLKDENIITGVFKLGNLVRIGAIITGNVRLAQLDGVKSDLYLLAAITDWSKALVNFDTEDHASKEEVLRAVERCYGEISAPVYADVSVIVDDERMIDPLKSFCEENARIRGFSARISRCCLGPNISETLAGADIADYLKNRNIPVIAGLDEFVKKVNSDYVLLGGGYASESHPEYRKAICELVHRGIIVASFGGIGFEQADFIDLEDAIESGSLPSGLAMNNAGEILTKPFNWEKVNELLFRKAIGRMMGNTHLCGLMRLDS